MRIRALMASVFLIGLFSLARPEASSVSAVNEENILLLMYQVKCQTESPFRGLHGEALVAGRKVRFDLFEELEETELLLGKAERAENITFEPSPNCRLERFSTRARSEKSTILAHAPYVVVRENQARNRSTDLPLMLAYSRLSTPRGWTLKYTLFFSDEDSLWTTHSTESQMTRYGRRTDIEWVYEVDLDKNGHPTARRYQGGLVGGMGHATAQFKGHFLPGTQHPILYNDADHNVMSDAGSAELPGYALVPREEIRKDFARERLMFEHPWMFAQSDDELKREERLKLRFTEYLYVGIRGVISRGKVIGKMAFDDGEKVLSGHGAGNLDRLGEDLWGAESFTAIPIGKKRLQELGHGEFSFERVSLLQPQFDVEELKFVRFENGVASDVSTAFRCDYDGLSTRCRF